LLENIDLFDGDGLVVLQKFNTTSFFPFEDVCNGNSTNRTKSPMNRMVGRFQITFKSPCGIGAGAERVAASTVGEGDEVAFALRFDGA